MTGQHKKNKPIHIPGYESNSDLSETLYSYIPPRFDKIHKLGEGPELSESTPLLFNQDDVRNLKIRPTRVQGMMGSRVKCSNIMSNSGECS